jgi:hypothetical protein
MVASDPAPEVNGIDEPANDEEMAERVEWLGCG